jgi:molybdenum cofactor synthesis domain-containing protein
MEKTWPDTAGIKVGILTISDRSSRGERPDASGQVISELVTQQGWQIVQNGIVPDERHEISALLSSWADSDEIDLILTTGGTGFSPRDITPEATLAVIDRLAPGLAETMRFESLKATPHAMLSRAVAGIRKRTLIINLPGSPKAVTENLKVVIPVIPHAVQLLKDDPKSEADHQRLTKA